MLPLILREEQVITAPVGEETYISLHKGSGPRWNFHNINSGPSQGATHIIKNVFRVKGTLLALLKGHIG